MRRACVECIELYQDFRKHPAIEGSLQRQLQLIHSQTDVRLTSRVVLASRLCVRKEHFPEDYSLER